MTVKYKIILLLITFSTLSARGQMSFNYKEGMIITNDHDTLFGLVKDRGEIRNSKACFFKKDNASQTEVFYPNDILAYMITGEKYYQSKELFLNNEFKQLFIEVLLKGKVDLFYYWNNDDKNFYIQKDDSVLINLSNENVHFSDLQHDINITIQWAEKELETKVYKDTLRSLFQDSRRIQYHILNMNYSKKSFINITENYIEETCGSDCIYYKKNLDLVRPRLGFYSGLTFSQIIIMSDSIAEGNSKTDLLITYPLGILFEFPISLVSDKWLFQTELNTSEISFTQRFSDPSAYNYLGVKYRQVGIALLLKYKMFQNRLISPSIAFGKNTSYVVSSKVVIDTSDGYEIHFFQKGGWFLEIGADYKLNSRYSLFSNFRFQTLNGLVVDNFNKGVSYNTLLADFIFPFEQTNSVGSLLIGLKF